MKNKTLVVGVLTLMSTASAFAGTNEKADILRCQVIEEKSESPDSSQSHPVTSMAADAKSPSTLMTFKYKGKEYIFAIGVPSLIPTRGMPRTTVALAREGELLTSMNSETLLDKMNNGTYNFETLQSLKVTMSRDVSLFISCSGRSERQQLIENTNSIQVLLNKVFGN